MIVSHNLLTDIEKFYAYTGLSQAMYYGADMKVCSTAYA